LSAAHNSIAWHNASSPCFDVRRASVREGKAQLPAGGLIEGSPITKNRLHP